jgi:glycosyltransferase involved in cell wall biosynthesis
MDPKKKVLIITYYWPPSAGSGVQRWLKFAKYLPDYGWEPVIFTPENPDFELKDESLLLEVPREVDVLRFPIWEPYGLLRALKKDQIKDPAVIIEKKEKNILDLSAIWLRANIFVPDPRVYWVKPSVKFLMDIMEKNQVDVIVTTGPPHSVHLIGRNLKRETGIKWLADFRDPWSSWEFLDSLPMTSMVRKRHVKLEQSVLKEADAVITISPTFKEEMEQIGQRPVNIITNGFDTADLPPSFIALPPQEEVFQIVYSGIIDSIRNPVPFLEAFKAAFELGNHQGHLSFVGKVSSQVQDFIQTDPWLRSHTECVGYVPHSEVFKYYSKAHLLLLILTDTKNAKGNIPGKLFEYLATGRNIIALGDPEGDSAHIMQESSAGKVFKHHEIQAMKNYLEEIRNSSSMRKKGNLEKYERKNLTGQLAQLLNEKINPVS